MTPRPLADLARRLPRGPLPLRDIDPAVLAELEALGLATRAGSYVQLNVTQAPGAAISALARGDLRRAAGFARPKRSAA
jgi:hypothetical protein